MSVATRSLQQTFEFGLLANAYAQLRERHPTVPARLAHQYAREGGDGGAATFEQFVCGITRGHDWSCAGEQDRCLCAYCGADGDA